MLGFTSFYPTNRLKQIIRRGIMSTGEGKICPNCGKDIGILGIMLAGIPNRIKCPHCKSRVKYQNTFLVIAILFIIGLILVVLIHPLVKKLHISPQPLEFIVYIFSVWLLWQPAEFFAALYLRSNKVLESVKKSG